MNPMPDQKPPILRFELNDFKDPFRSSHVQKRSDFGQPKLLQAYDLKMFLDDRLIGGILNTPALEEYVFFRVVVDCPGFYKVFEELHSSLGSTVEVACRKKEEIIALLENRPEINHGKTHIQTEYINEWKPVQELWYCPEPDGKRQRFRDVLYYAGKMVGGVLSDIENGKEIYRLYIMGQPILSKEEMPRFDTPQKLYHAINNYRGPLLNRKKI